MFNVKNALIVSALFSSASFANSYQDYELNKYEGFYKAKKAKAFVVNKVGVFSACSSAMYDGGILKVEIKNDGSAISLQNKYEYLSYPFDKNNSDLKYVTSQRDTIAIGDSQGRTHDYTYPASYEDRPIESRGRAYMKTKTKIKDNSLEVTKLLVPKKIGAIVKSIESRHILELDKHETELTVGVSSGGAKVLGMNLGSSSSCKYERISEAEYKALSKELDKKSKAKRAKKINS